MMKKNSFLSMLVILIFQSCVGSKISSPIEGIYTTVESGYKIQINPDSTFTYSIGFSGSLIARCSGDWRLNSKKDFIKLTCQKEYELEELTSTYMSKRIHIFKVKNNRLIQDKLKLSKKLME